MPTATVEDYMKRIYALQSEQPDQHVGMGRLAELVGVAPGTATAMVKKLARDGLIAYEPYSGVTLTEAGRRLALDVLRRHRLIEALLVDILHLDWSEVHEEAERLEHVVSDKLLAHIDARLGHPAFDPHGDPIPTRSGHLREQSQRTLADAAVGERLRIARVLAQDEAFLRFAAAHGMRPGDRVEVVDRDAHAETLTLRPAGHAPMTLGRSAATKLLVEPNRAESR